LFALALLLAGCAMVPSASLDAARSELASTGKMRLAVPENPNYLNVPMQPPYSGVAVDIGNAIAKDLGVAVEIVAYPTLPALLADAGSKWDVTLIGIEASRRAVVDYSVPYAITPNSYLVPAGSALMTIPDVDRAGVRVAVSRGTIQHMHLQGALRQASVVSTDTTTTAARDLTEGRADALAANRSTVEDLASRMPGYRVLPGSFYEVQYAAGVPKGRSAAAAHVNRVIEQMRANGAIAAALAKANLKTLTVPSY
jgi:polar amino acid transport system substrate-binding protein